MTNTLFYHIGWFTLGSLLSLSPQLVACDTSAPSEKKNIEPAVLSEGSSLKKKQANQAARAEHSGSSDAASTKNEATTEVAISDEERPRPKEQAVALKQVPTIKRLVIASAIEKREPIALAAGKVDEPILAFLEVEHQSDQEAKLVVTFHHPSGKKVGFIELSVPGESPRYRTWGRTRNIRTPGQWTAIVTTEEGTELARQSFEVHS